MFNCKMLEDQTNVINICDVGRDTLVIILKYIYTGQISINETFKENVLELIYAADKVSIFA